MSVSALKLIKQLKSQSAAKDGKGAPAMIRPNDNEASHSNTRQLSSHLTSVHLDIPFNILGHGSPHVLEGVPTIAYANSIMNTDTEAALIDCILNACEPSKWVQLRNRRLQMWGGTVTAEGLADIEPLPVFLTSIIDSLMVAGVYPPGCRPNHVLINEYHPGQGIMPHTDGPAYYPCTTTMSLGSPAIMRLAPRSREGGGFKPCQEVVLQRRSMVVFTDAAYSDHLHAISEDHEEVVGASAPCENLAAAGVAVGEVLPRTLRISLTIRHVPLPGQPRPWLKQQPEG